LGFEPTQAPEWHVSVSVQPFPSLHPVPSSACGFEHNPVAESQTPAVWHPSLGVQTFGFVPTHWPDWQESVSVHASPSLQPVPSGAVGFEQWPVPGSQMSDVQGSLSLQSIGFAPTH
jgi:hypothetical protein